MARAVDSAPRTAPDSNGVQLIYLSIGTYIYNYCVIPIVKTRKATIVVGPQTLRKPNSIYCKTTTFPFHQIEMTASLTGHPELVKKLVGSFGRKGVRTGKTFFFDNPQVYAYTSRV
jgi:hypothetical protein